MSGSRPLQVCRFAFKECLCQSTLLLALLAVVDVRMYAKGDPAYEGWNFNSGNYLFTTDTK